MDTFDDSELWQMAADAALDRPENPLHDDLETEQRIFHRHMAELALQHYEEVQRAIENRQCYAFVMINGKACDPELELRLSELEGLKEQAIERMKGVLAMRTASILVHHLT